MAGFDDSVFEKPLDAETKTRKPGIRGWVTEKMDEIKCCFRDGCRK